MLKLDGMKKAQHARRVIVLWSPNLTLGRAHAALCLASASGDHAAKAETHLNAAVDGLRQAGQQDHLLRGLLARAALWRVTGAYAAARADLDEVLDIAERGGMRLFEADAHLELARLALAEGDRAGARAHFEVGRGMVEEMGYSRRFGEVEELARRLGEG